MTLQEFQKTHGLKWKALVQQPEFLSAMQFLNVEKLNSIPALTDADIEKNGREILSDLRGHLKLENDLMTLHEKRIFKFPESPDEPDYPDPAEEELEAMKPKRKR